MQGMLVGPHSFHSRDINRVATPLIRPNGLFRPQVAGLIYDQRDRFLFTMNPKAVQDGNWQVPQGGVDPDERIRDAFCREMCEELGIARRELENLHLLGRFAQELKNPRDGYNAKRYLYVSARYTGDPDALEPNSDEIAHYKWVERAEVPKVLDTFRNQVRAAFTRSLIEMPL